MPHLRYTLRQPIGASKGKVMLVLNDAVEVVDDDGNVIADLSDRVRSLEIIDDVGSARIIRLELFAGELAVESEPERPQIRRAER